MQLRHLELNGGQVIDGEITRLILPPVSEGYADAQIDDYGLVTAPGRRPERIVDIKRMLWPFSRPRHPGLTKPTPTRRRYPWTPGTTLTLRARFSHGRDQLQGTAGFGFWNAPFGDPTVRTPALPQAAWFFYASQPSDMPFAASGPGRGWFAATVDAGTPKALLTAPLAPPVLLLNQSKRLRRRIWPWVQNRLQISFAPLDQPMTTWQEYKLQWLPTGCTFTIGQEIVLQTPYSPRGPLGFVCWIDNQYLVATPHGRFHWGTLPTTQTQTLEIANLHIKHN